ncbi:MAG: hypothetical protein WA417_17120 [Stellaceae bacterium]
MTEIRTRILVGADHRITGTAPAAVPPGEHEVTIEVASALIRQRSAGPFDVNSLPAHDLGPWPEGLSLRREDIYDEDAR